MNNIILMNEKREIMNNLDKKNVEELIKVSDYLLYDTITDLSDKKTISLPISELASLGAAASSLESKIRTVTETTNIDTKGLYRLYNQEKGDILKKCKDGSYWGAFNTADGKSKFAKLVEAEPIQQTKTIVMPIDPAIMMMAVAVASIEHQLKHIVEMEHQILSFLENDKQSEIEADVETLISILSKYKYNWDDNTFIKSNLNIVNDILKDSRKNINFYLKVLNDILDKKQLIVPNVKVKTAYEEIKNSFLYYRLSLYSFSLASLLEIVLNGSYKEEYILEVKREIEQKSNKYREIFNECSCYLENMCKSSLELNVLKGIGNATKMTGKIIGNIPVVKDGKVDEFLISNGNKVKKSSHNVENKILKSFSKFNNPGTLVFTEQMNELNQIYNHTTNICFNSEKIFLVSDQGLN